MKRNYLNLTLILAGVFVVLSMVLGLSLADGLVIFLSWNMILAIFAYALSILVVYLHKKKIQKLMLYISIVLWVIFFPNTFYILTDFIHFQNYDFFNIYPNIYTLNIKSWYVFFDIVIGALIGLKLGLLSIAHVKSIIPKEQKKYEPILLGSLFVLSSVAIYLGRFIRLNSWNVFHLAPIFKAIFQNFSFFSLFVLLFTVIQTTIYVIFNEKGE